jgi:hypothetical protein
MLKAAADWCGRCSAHAAALLLPLSHTARTARLWRLLVCEAQSQVRIHTEHHKHRVSRLGITMLTLPDNPTGFSLQPILACGRLAAS